MTDPETTPLETVRLQLYRTLRGAAAVRHDPNMVALAMEVGILEAIRDLDALLSPEATTSTRFPGKGRARRGPGACREARAWKAAETVQDASDPPTVERLRGTVARRTPWPQGFPNEP